MSKTDCEESSGIPQPEDEIILLGNRTDKARQSAMMLSAYGNDAPYIDTYDGIDSYDLSGKLLTREGNLNGIVDEVFGQLSGSGFYGKKVYLRGKFAFSSGVNVEDKLGQTDAQMDNLQGQLTSQQGQLTTQPGTDSGHSNQYHGDPRANQARGIGDGDHGSGENPARHVEPFEGE